MNHTENINDSHVYLLPGDTNIPMSQRVIFTEQEIPIARGLNNNVKITTTILLATKEEVDRREFNVPTQLKNALKDNAHLLFSNHMNTLHDFMNLLEPIVNLQTSQQVDNQNDQH